MDMLAWEPELQPIRLSSHFLQFLHGLPGRSTLQLHAVPVGVRHVSSACVGHDTLAVHLELPLHRRVDHEPETALEIWFDETARHFSRGC